MSNVPKHITIIMDGNGRWAKQRGLERLFGHRAGKESVSQACEYAAEMGVEYLSLFAFSEENWNRPEAEVNGLMRLMAKAMVDEKPTLLKNGIRFRAIGDLSRLDASLVEDIRQTERDTAVGTRMTLLVFLSYSGKWDVLQAAEKYAQACTEAVLAQQPVPALTPELYASYLATAGIPDPDLMIRTSGEQRISNYMLWQCAYTEFYFTDVLWPDFRRADFAKAIEAFQQRKRRFGLTGEQIIEK
jgi:undecaprenyl diphosphate synthase